MESLREYSGGSMTRNKLFFVIWFFVSVSFFLTTVTAVPPVSIVSQFTEGVAIESAIGESIPINQNISFEFHVYNLSNGLILSNESVLCSLHIYDKYGSHLLIDNNLEFESVNFDFSAMVNQDNFTQLGTYEYLINCNSSTIGGYYIGGVYATSSGEILETYGSIGIGIILFLVFLVGGFFLYIGTITQEEGIKLFYLFIGFIFIIILVGGISITAGHLHVPGIKAYTNVTLFTTLIIFIVTLYYLFINLTKRAMRNMGANKGYMSDDMF